MDDKTRSDEEKFSFGVRELRLAEPKHSLSLAHPKKPAEKPQGCDPYNSSGSFDRKKNWSRIGKR